MTENSTKINAILTKPLHSHNTMESHPLISTIITLYTLIFLYFPTIAASPLIISTSILLLSLLRLGATQRISQEQIKKKKFEPENPSLQVPCDFAYHDDPDSEPILDPLLIGFHDNYFVESNVDSNCEKLDSAFDKEMNLEPNSISKASSKDENYSRLYKETKDVILNRCENSTVLDTKPKPEPEPRPFYNDSFSEWNVKAPLEVIYEAYEGEGEEEEEYREEKKRDEELRAIERYASLSMYYPETDMDTDSSSGGDSPVIGNWDSPHTVCFRWNEEDREEELMIEIGLDCKRNNEAEEDNLIEIDLSFPAR